MILATHLSAVALFSTYPVASELLDQSDAFTEAEIANLCSMSGFQSCVDSLAQDGDVMGIDIDSSNTYIGLPFFVMDMNSEGDLLVNEERVYYPVVCSDAIAALIVCFKNENSYSFSCGQYFADSLNLFSASSDEYVLYADTDGNVYSIDTNENVRLLHSLTDVTIMQSPQYDEELEYTDISGLKLKTANFTPNIQNSRVITTDLLVNYPGYVQTGGDCWAYVVLSMANYKLGTHSIEQVYAAFYHGNGFNYTADRGASNNEVRNTMAELFDDYTVTWQRSKLTGSQIKLTINEDCPAFIAGFDDETQSGHSVALVGYRSDSAYTSSSVADGVIGYYMMNPQLGRVVYHVYDPVNCYFYNDAGTKAYLWNHSITIN